MQRYTFLSIYTRHEAAFLSLAARLYYMVNLTTRLYYMVNLTTRLYYMVNLTAKVLYTNLVFPCLYSTLPLLELQRN